MALADVLFAILLSTPVAAPPEGMTETRAELEVRLRSIADDAAAVANDDPTDALLLLAVAQHESDFALDVDRGPCRAGTCDGSRAACLLQIQASPERRAALFADRRLCFAVGLRALKHGRLAECPSVEMQFAGYAGGSCSRGARGSRELYAYWQRWIARYAAEVAREAKEEQPK
jgi:hypothetical protein